MSQKIPLASLSTEDKLRMMEELWDDLCASPAKIESPAWHRDVLADRADAIENGTDRFQDWDVAKGTLRKLAR